MDEINKEKFYNRLFMYPSDFHYLKAIADEVKIDESELWRLSSLMGGQELANTLPLVKYQNFRYDEKNPNIFRFNLHTHSTCSDGDMSPQEWLEEGRKLADEHADADDNFPAFTAALTDHDCIIGAKEIVKLLIADPIRYKNLRVVLGCELGAVWKDESRQKNPLEFELIWFALNPFDIRITNFLAEHNKRRVNAAKAIVKTLAERFQSYHLTYQEACDEEKLLAKNQGLGFYNRIKNYAVSKIREEEFYDEIYDICKMYNNPFEVSEDVNPYQDADEICSLVRSSGFGFLGIAHPQKLNVSKFIKPEFEARCQSENKNAAYELIYNWLDWLRARGVRAMDINYQFCCDDMIKAQKMLLGELCVDNNFDTYKWLKLFVDYADKYGILKSGGYDTHGTSLRARK